MSMITTSISEVSRYAEGRVASDMRPVKLYYRKSTGEYFAVGSGSDQPPFTQYEGKWVWNGQRVQWVSA